VVGWFVHRLRVVLLLIVVYSYGPQATTGFLDTLRVRR
jgi:hypothetical protein